MLLEHLLGDLHAHVGNTVDLVQDRAFHTRESVEQDLRTYAAYGVTTVLSMGTDQDTIFAVRESRDTSVGKDVDYPGVAVLTVGLNYMPIPNVAFKLDYQDIDIDDRGTGFQSTDEIGAAAGPAAAKPNRATAQDLARKDLNIGGSFVVAGGASGG